MSEIGSGDPSIVHPYAPGCPIAWVDDELAACFPMDGIIHAYCWWAVQNTDAHPAFHIGSILPILAHELVERDFVIDHGLEKQQPTWWSCLCAASGVAKTTAMTMARNFAKEYWAPRNHNPFEQFSGSVQGLVSRLGEAFVTGNGPDRQTRAIIYREEFSEVLHADSAATNLINLFDGDTISRHTRSAQLAAQKAGLPYDGIVAPNPRVSAQFSLTPSSLEAVATPEHMNGGLFSRLHWIVEHQIMAQLSPTRQDTTRARSTALQAWADWGSWVDGLTTRGEAKIIVIPEHVKQIAMDNFWTPFLEKENPCENPYFGAWRRCFSRIDTLAALYAVSQHRLVVQETDMLEALAFVERGFKSVTGLGSRVAVDRVVRNATRLEDTLFDLKRPMILAQVHKAMPIAYQYFKEAVEQATALDNVRQLSEYAVTGVTKRGRPAVYLVLTRAGLADVCKRNTLSADRVHAYKCAEEYGDNDASRHLKLIKAPELEAAKTTPPEPV